MDIIIILLSYYFYIVFIFIFIFFFSTKKLKITEVRRDEGACISINAPASTIYSKSRYE